MDGIFEKDDNSACARYLEARHKNLSLLKVEETHSVFDLTVALLLLSSTDVKTPLTSPQSLARRKFHVATTLSSYTNELSSEPAPLNPAPIPPAAFTIRVRVPPPLPLEADMLKFVEPGVVSCRSVVATLTVILARASVASFLLKSRTSWKACLAWPLWDERVGDGTRPCACSRGDEVREPIGVVEALARR